eukprot:CCRYP_013727-RA/>CCRYP_013727-RA protein AED:0.11 eAED:0.11 QI:202/1/1/1/0.72/0.75/12/3044/689
MKFTSPISVILTSILPRASTALTASGGPSYPVEVEPHNYTDSEGFLLQGFLSRPNEDNVEQTSKLPAVIIVHDRDGPDTYEQQRATLIANELGYVGFAADIFGYGVVLPDDGQGWDGARGEFVQQFSSNATLFATRIQAAVDYVRGLEYVDEAKVAMVGYCFGGTGVVHYLNTRGNTTDVAGVCAVHPSLFGDWGGPVVDSIDIPALFLTGGSDFLTGPEAMATLEKDMSEKTNGVNSSNSTPWETVRYAKINHAFSNWFSENYDERADSRSWESFIGFTSDVFGMGTEGQPSSGVEPSVTTVNYTDGMDGDYPLIGYLALPNDNEELSPVIVILPSKMDSDGPDKYEQQRATQFVSGEDAKYVAFVADIYSHDVKDTIADELEGLHYSNVTKFMSRVSAAIDYAKSIEGVDPNNVALLGFGFGGSGALMYGMRMAGEIDHAVKTIVSFHGEIGKIINVTMDILGLSEDSTSASSGGWGSGGSGNSWGNGGGSGSWSSSGSSGGGSTSSSSGTSSGSAGNAANKNWAERSLTSNSSNPQILIQSGVVGDDMNDVIKLEEMLIAIGANYELSRFSGASADFTNWNSTSYDSRAAARSFNQVQSVLREVFTDEGNSSVSAPADETESFGAPSPVPIDESSNGMQSTAPTSHHHDDHTHSPMPTSNSAADRSVCSVYIFYAICFLFVEMRMF